LGSSAREGNQQNKRVRNKEKTNVHQAFTAWVNGVLERIGERIADISTDFSDGILLVHFLELLSNKKIGKKLELEKKTEIYRVQNLYLALQFVSEVMGVKAEGVAAEGVQSLYYLFLALNIHHPYIPAAFFVPSTHFRFKILLEEIVSSFLVSCGHSTENTVSLLSRKEVILSLSHSFPLLHNFATDKSSEEGLLQWCKNITSEYNGVDIKSFKTGYFLFLSYMEGNGGATQI
jgi:hypothetical protein